MQTIVKVILFLLALTLSACKQEPEFPPAKAWYFEVFEENRDTFPEELAHVDLAGAPPPFTFDDDKLLVHPDYENTTDPEILKEIRLTLGDRSKPMSQCHVFLVHEIYYAGVGRESQSLHYYAYPDFPATVSFPSPPIPEDGTLSFDPNEAPFVEAVESMRVFVPGTELRITEQEGEIHAGLEGNVALILPGQDRLLLKGSLTANVVEMPTTGEDFIFDESFGVTEEEKADLIVDPVIPYGSVTFETELTLTFYGKIPVVSMITEPEDQEDEL